MTIKVGDRAPDFTLPSQYGDNVTLSEYLGKKSVVLYFYPKDETPGCTKEACSFRDSYQQLTDLGAEVLGVAAFGEHDFGISEQDLQDIVGYIPKNSSALLLIVEHIWAKKIKQSLVNADGTMIAQGIITPELVVKVGRNLASEPQS